MLGHVPKASDRMFQDVIGKFMEVYVHMLVKSLKRTEHFEHIRKAFKIIKNII